MREIMDFLGGRETVSVFIGYKKAAVLTLEEVEPIDIAENMDGSITINDTFTICSGYKIDNIYEDCIDISCGDLIYSFIRG